MQKSSRARHVAAGIAAAAFALLVAGCTSTASDAPTSATPIPTVSSPSPTPPPTPTATPAGTPFSSVALGDCLTIQAGSDQQDPATVTIVPCSVSHSSEVFGLPALGDSSFPGDENATAQAEDDCMSAFTSYVGVSVYNATLNYSVFTPTQQEWDAGRHVATCVAFYTGGDIVGSVKGLGSGTPRTS